VPGGGVALLRSQKALDKIAKTEKNDDQAIGVRIVRRALEEPLRQIANNAGLEGSVVINEVRGMAADTGFNAQNEKYEDMFKAGIIDPAKVVRSALQNAASIASLMLTTEALVSENPEEAKASAPAPDMGGGMGGMGGGF